VTRYIVGLFGTGVSYMTPVIMFNILVHRLLVQTNIGEENKQPGSATTDVKENHSSGLGTSFSRSGGNDRSHGNIKILIS
jgi:hypothetical protein